MNSIRLIFSAILIALLCINSQISAQTTVTIGDGTSSSSTRGPLQRSDTASSTVFSRWIQIFTQEELSNAGLVDGVSISQLNWELASSNVIIGDGDATIRIYVRNSSATEAISDSWANHTAGSQLVYDEVYNTTNNFPGANGWMPFTFDSPFAYTGGTLEVAVDWDCSQISTPAFSGNGAIKWRWTSVAPDFLVVKKTASSSPPSTITDLRDERANIQIVYSNTAICQQPENLYVSNPSANSADFSWSAADGASMYNWKVVLAGDDPEGVAIDEGSTSMTMATSNVLSELTSYDLYVESNCDGESSVLVGPISFATSSDNLSSAIIGLETSSSSTRGPFQRSDTASSTVFSRFIQTYTAVELADAGIVEDDIITSVSWDLASENVMIGNGNANLKVYVKNSSSTQAIADSWLTLIDGSSLLIDNDYNTVNNFPGENGWMTFDFSAPFVYTGGALEVAVDWDCSQVSTPAFSGDGSLKWRWDSTAPDFLVAKKTSSSSPSSTISDLNDERANIQFEFFSSACNPPSSLSADNVTETSADLSWQAAGAAESYNWLIVDAGQGPEGTPVDSGNTSESEVTTSALMAGTSYDLYIESSCGEGAASDYVGPFNFTTLCSDVSTEVSFESNTVSCNGDANGSINMTISEGVAPFEFDWSNDSEEQNLDNLTAGLYFVTITDANGCPYIDSVLVSEPEELILSTSSIPDTDGAGVGAASVEVTGGTPPYVYEWDGSEDEETLSDLITGTYSIVVVDANGCSSTAEVFVDDIVGINDFNSELDVVISPNPTNGQTFLDINLERTGDVRIAVYSSAGEEVVLEDRRDINELKYLIDFSGLSDGIYFLNLSIDGQIINKKLIYIK